MAFGTAVRGASAAVLLCLASQHGAAQMAASTSASAPAPASERFAVCLACHGPGGVSQQALTPSLAGQHSFYAITQLFLFREGRRSSEAMTAVAKGMSDADMRAFSELIGKLPPQSDAITPTSDMTRTALGAAIATRLRCSSCHGNDFSGAQQVPRIARQREDYLLKALTEFRAGARVGYTGAMAEALAGVSPDEIAVLASYLSSFSKREP